MAGMNFIGSYSGIDQSTIDKLMQAEKMPLLKLTNAKASITEQQNAWKDINTRLNSLFEKIKTLQSNSTFATKTSTSSNDKNVSMTAGNGATPGTYKVRVKSLATSTSVVGTKVLKDGQENKTELGLNGEFTINLELTDEKIRDKYLAENKIAVYDPTDVDLKAKVDKYIKDYKDSRTITVGNGDSLNDITANINKKTKDTGVTAVIIDGRLSLSHKETGKDKNIVLTDLSGGSLISGENDYLDPSKTSLGLEIGSTRKSGADAVFSINDLPLTSASNNAKGALEGVTINLTKAHDPSNTDDHDTVTIAQDNSILTKAVQDFVDQYNSTMTFIEDKMKAGDPKLVGSKGTLAGDSSLMRLHSSLRSMVTSVYANENTGIKDIKDISQLGVTTIDKFGQLKFDASKLSEELSKNADGVKNFFNSTVGGKEVGFANKLKVYVESFVSPSLGIIKGKNASFDKTLKDLATQIDNFSIRMEKKEAYYIKKFTALDVAIMKSEDQMSWLQGQVDSMNGIKR